MLKGYRCPAGGEDPGRANEIDYCLGKCPVQCVAPPLLAAMYKADTGNYHNDNTYLSASMLAGQNCARQTLWERTEDFYSVPIKRYWPFRGTHAHTICEGAGDLIAKYGWLQEIRTSAEFKYPDVAAPIFDDQGKWTGDFSKDEHLIITVKGTADAYNPYTKQLVDTKSMADAKAVMTIEGKKGGTFSKNLEDAHVWQFNIYRLLLARTRISQEVRDRFASLGLPELKGKNFPAPTELIMQGIAMMTIPRSGRTYPIKEKWGGQTLHDIDPVPVLMLTEIDAYVREKAFFWYRHLVMGVPAAVVPESKKWLCASCQFNGEVIEGERCFPAAERARNKKEAVADE
jgi:hypothetical protein